MVNMREVVPDHSCPDLVSDHDDDDLGGDKDDGSQDGEGGRDTTLDLELCLSLLDLPEFVLDRFFNMPPVVAPDGTEIPAAYVRTRLSQLPIDSSVAPDFVLHVSDSLGEVRDFDLHSIVWDAQCTTRFTYNTSASSPSETRTTLPIELISIEGLAPFVEWLYTNDEDDLYESLLAGSQTSIQFVPNFCQLVRTFGCVNHKFAGIVRALYSSPVG